MKNTLLLLSFLWGVSPLLHSQSAQDCATDWWVIQDLQSIEFQEKHQQYEQDVLQVFEQKKQVSWLPDNPKTIPVVVHIIHQNGPENLSNDQVEQAVVWLNQALANQGNFNQGSGTDCGIQCCLAKRTPANGATNGITRTVSALTEMEMEFDNLELKNLSRWDTKQYLNIWVVKKICSATYGCNVYGYAHLPYAHGSNIDGIVIESSYLTDLGKMAGLAHELGHYLGLYHTFEGNCNNNNCLTDGDRICDTPPDESTASVPCGDQVNTCNTDTDSGPFSTDQPDMTWNFLDYGILACFHDYTPDQATRMNATLEGIRKSLLESKGCLPPCTASANANFTGPNTANAGETITYTSNSTNAGSLAWTVNGQPAGNQATLNYQFPAPGVYVIKLIVQATNPALCGPDEITKTVVVGCQTVSAFTANNLAPEADQQVYFSNNSQNATQTEWYINGVLQTQPLDSIVFGSPGEYSIELVSGNGFCADTQEVVILVQGVCVQKTFEFLLNVDQFSTAGTDLDKMANGNIMHITVTSSSTFSLPPVISMFKPNGQFLWSKKWDVTAQIIVSTKAKSTPDGGFLLFVKTNTVSSAGNIDSNFYYLCKYDVNGNEVWSKLIHKEMAIPSGPIELHIFPDETILAKGSFLAKFTSTGNKIWALEFTNFDWARTTTDGGSIGVLLGANINLILKLNPDGTPQWMSTLEMPGVALKDVVVHNNGDLYLIGALDVLPAGVIHGMMAKYNANGQFIWAKTYRQIPVSTYLFEHLCVGNNNDLIVAGTAKVDDPGMGPLKDYDILLAFDTSGTVLWNSHFNGYSNTQSIIHIPGAGYCLSGIFGWIKRVNNLGEAFSCSGTSREITTLSANPISNTLVQLPFPSMPLEEMDMHFPLTPISAVLDTLCAPSCLIAVEICNNNLDDDGDGLFDCLDPQCNCEEERCDNKTGNLWYFGDKAALDFSTSPPTSLGNGQSSSTGNSATICDVKGNLLLYTDGKQIYNRFHQPMPNGNILSGQVVFDVMIIPHPGQTGQYYVIANYDGGESYYSLVDLTLNDGLGDVVPGQKNLFLAFDVQGMAAVKSCGFEGYWFLTRRFDSQGNFLTFRIDQNGLNTMPVVSPTNQPVGLVRQIKISPDGLRAACTYYANSVFDSSAVSIFRFDPGTTGAVTDPQLLGKFKEPFKAYGLEFSPNNKYLYVTGTLPGTFQLVQYDVQAGSTQNIINSRIGISKLPGQTIAFLQLGPDGKIYAPTYSVLQPTAFYLDVIHKPNNPGLTCNFEHQSFDLSLFFPNGTAKDGTCNVIASLVSRPNIDMLPESPDTICALGTPNLYQLQPLSCGLDSITWSVVGLGAQIQSNFQSAIIRYLNYGHGRVIVKAFSPCGNVSDTLDVWVVDPPNTVLNLGPDREVCDNGVFSFNAGSGFSRYQWSDGTTDSTTTTLFPGVYWVNVWDACGNLQTDTIVVSIKSASVLHVGPDIPQQCSGFTQTYNLPQGFSSWNWSPSTALSCTNCPVVSISPDVSNTWVIVGTTSDGCISVDTLRAVIRDTLLFQLDTFVCIGQNLPLFGIQLPADTTAQFLMPASGTGCDTLLTVTVSGIEATSSGINVTICANKTYAYNGLDLLPGTVTSFQFSSLQLCDSTVTVTVNSYPPLSVSLPKDTTIRIGGSVLLESTVSGTAPFTYSWTPTDYLSCTGCVDPLSTPLENTVYSVQVADANGCQAEESIFIQINNECRIRVPNAFTPNGDGANDLFRPMLDPCIQTVLGWKVVNRWGETVFEQYDLPATDPLLGWDGQWKGGAHPSDVLIWYGTFEKYNGERGSESGQVTLLR